MVPSPGVGRGAPPSQRWGGEDDNPCPNLQSVQRLRLLPGKKTLWMCRNVALPILGGAVFCTRGHMGLYYYKECLRKGLHTHPLAEVVDEVAAAMTTARPPTVKADGST